MNEQNKEKLIAHLEKGTEIFLVLNDDTGIIGVVERNVLCWEETDGNWHELTVYVGGQHITINSNNVKEVRKCIPHTEDEHNQIIGRDAFEIYNVPYGLSDVDFLKTVLDSCERNQNRIESVAEKCKGSIPMCAYEAMLNWDVRLAMCS